MVAEASSVSVVQVGASSAGSHQQQGVSGCDLSGEAAVVIEGLINVASGRTVHVGMGMCPDSIEGHHVRDADCPACAAILAAERLLKGCGR